MNKWLLHESALNELRHTMTSGLQPTASQQLEYDARTSRFNGGDLSEILTIAGDTAEITVQGVLTSKPDIIAFLFGGGNTVYSDINAALRVAEQDPKVKTIEMVVNSPGGSVDGLFDTIAAMQGVSKPIKAVVSGTAASAAYALVAQADNIVLSNRASGVGSIGIAATIFVNESRVEIASTKAPNKRPDVTTDKGKAVIREELDALHDLFVESIADGRKTTSDNVNADFGKGSMLLADEALKRGMIDGIESAKSSKTVASGGDKKEVKLMNAKELLAQHPDVHAVVLKEGATDERDRINAHLTMGKASGDMVTALAAVEDGSEMTATLTAKYMAAGMNRNSTEARQGDSDDTNTDNVNSDDATKDKVASDKLLELSAEFCGVETGET